MAEKIVHEITKITDHPLEDFLNIEPNSTEVTKIEQKTALIRHEDYDDKDVENESDFQEVYDEAMSGYQNLKEAIEDIEPKYAARSYEVANQALQIALQAAKEKAELKKHKDKLNKTVKGATTNNNTFIMDTNTLINEIRKSKAIEVKATDVTPIENNNENKG